MLWIAPTEKIPENAAQEKRLGDATNRFRAKSRLKTQEQCNGESASYPAE
jgi:hypothetical protein